MKTIFFIGFILISNLFYSQNFTLKGFYAGFDQTFVFEDQDGDYFEFHDIDKKILEKFKLKDESLIGKAFLITYQTSEQKDDEGYEYEFNKIIALKSIQLEKKQEVEEEEMEEDDY